MSKRKKRPVVAELKESSVGKSLTSDPQDRSWLPNGSHLATISTGIVAILALVFSIYTTIQSSRFDARLMQIRSEQVELLRNANKMQEQFTESYAKIVNYLVGDDYAADTAEYNPCNKFHYEQQGKDLAYILVSKHPQKYSVDDLLEAVKQQLEFTDRQWNDCKFSIEREQYSNINFGTYKIDGSKKLSLKSHQAIELVEANAN